MSTICADHQVKCDFNFLCTFLIAAISTRGILCVIGPRLVVLLFEPRLVPVKVGAQQFVVEEDFDICQFIELVEQSLIQACSVDGVYALARSAL